MHSTIESIETVKTIGDIKRLLYNNNFYSDEILDFLFNDLNQKKYKCINTSGPNFIIEVLDFDNESLRQDVSESVTKTIDKYSKVFEKCIGKSNYNVFKHGEITPSMLFNIAYNKNGAIIQL